MYIHIYLGNFSDWDSKNYPSTPEWSLFNWSMVHLAGWYDIFTTVQIRTAIGINSTGQINAKGNQILIIEPTGHCGGGAIKWPNASYGGDLMDNTLAPAIFQGAFDAATKNELFDIHKYVSFNILTLITKIYKLNI